MAYRLGMGATAVDCAPQADWSLHNFIAAFNPGCWKYSPEAWSEMAQFPSPPQPVPVLTPPDLRMVPIDAADAEATRDAIIAQNKAAQNQQYADFFRSVERVGPECEGAYLNRDGSWSCPSEVNWVLWLGLAAGAFFALSVWSGRR